MGFGDGILIKGNMVFLLFVLLQRKTYLQGYIKHSWRRALAYTIPSLFVRIPHYGFSLVFFVTSSYVVSHGFFIPPTCIASSAGNPK
jgi:hypothetical protein